MRTWAPMAKGRPTPMVPRDLHWKILTCSAHLHCPRSLASKWVLRVGEDNIWGTLTSYEELLRKKTQKSRKLHRLSPVILPTLFFVRLLAWCSGRSRNLCNSSQIFFGSEVYSKRGMWYLETGKLPNLSLSRVGPLVTHCRGCVQSMNCAAIIWWFPTPVVMNELSSKPSLFPTSRLKHTFSMPEMAQLRDEYIFQAKKHERYQFYDSLCLLMCFHAQCAFSIATNEAGHQC